MSYSSWTSDAIVQKLRSTNFVNTFNNHIGSMKFRNNGTNTMISQWFPSMYTIHNVMRFFHNWLTLLSQSVPRKFIWKIYGFYVHHLDNMQLSCSYVNYKLEISWKWTCTTIFVGPTHCAYVSWFSYIIRFWVFICYQDCEKVIGFHTFQKCVSHKSWICELATTHQCGVSFLFFIFFI